MSAIATLRSIPPYQPPVGVANTTRYTLPATPLPGAGQPVQPAIEPKPGTFPSKPPILHVPNELGTIATTFLNKWPVQSSLRVAGAFGATEGYATLADATTALAALTKGAEVGAVAVIQQDGRFYGEQVLQFSRPGGSTKGSLVDVERLYPDLGRHVVASTDAFVALVDGTQTITPTFHGK